MATDPLKSPKPAPFPAEKLGPFLRVMFDPEGTGELSSDEAAIVERVEQNVARRDRPADS